MIKIFLESDKFSHIAGDQEVEYALKGMPKRKSPGPDDIVTEMLVAAGDMGIAELTKLSNMM